MTLQITDGHRVPQGNIPELVTDTPDVNVHLTIPAHKEIILNQINNDSSPDARNKRFQNLHQSNQNIEA